MRKQVAVQLFDRQDEGADRTASKCVVSKVGRSMIRKITGGAYQATYRACLHDFDRGTRNGLCQARHVPTISLSTRLLESLVIVASVSIS